jgi:hypothetical protein
MNEHGEKERVDHKPVDPQDWEDERLPNDWAAYEPEILAVLLDP